MKILVDNGHGINTAGKRSPDGRHREYAWCREIAKRIVQRLKDEGFDAERIVTEENDVRLSTRCERVNAFCKRLGNKNVMLVSVHNNAAGMGSEWMNVRGWCVYVYQGQYGQQASKESKLLADCLYEEAKAMGWKILQYLPAQTWWGKNLTILRKTNCPAVLTENFFQDNKEDVEFLLSEEGKQQVVEHHIRGIKKYIATYKSL